MSLIEPFRACVPQADLDDLRQRIAHTRWPDEQTVSDLSQGVPLERMRELCDYWGTHYDWRRCEARLNVFPQYRTEIDGLAIHFLHVRSAHHDALPLLMTHGWPGSVLEFMQVIEPLTAPQKHGGSAADAFHIVIPSLPGFGFSGKPVDTGWTVQRIARAWHELMRRLGYLRYVAQGGDWGARVTTELAAMAPAGLAAMHVNVPVGMPDMSNRNEWTLQEREYIRQAQHMMKDEMGYMTQQRTRPQTIGYPLADSPVGQAAWIYEKLQTWSDCAGDPEGLLGRDALLDNITLYWLTNCGASSARIYWESANDGFDSIRVDVPAGCSIFPREIVHLSRRWAEKTYRNLIYWNELDRGGHFAAFEQPQLFVEELRACFRLTR